MRDGILLNLNLKQGIKVILHLHTFSSKELFWKFLGNFWGIFLDDFFAGMFMEEFFGRDFLQGCFGGFFFCLSSCVVCLHFGLFIGNLVTQNACKQTKVLANKPKR